MRLLIWQWGRRGAGPRYAMELAAALQGVPGVAPLLSLSRQAEIMQDGIATCDLPIDTYRSAAGWAARLASAPILVPRLVRQLRPLRLDAALCAMPGPLDLVMAAALRRLGVPFAVVVHDADLHPGEILRLQAVFQRRLLQRAGALVALSDHVARRLGEQGVLADRPLLSAALSSFAFGPPPPPPRAHGGKLRLLSFGRLLPYKGLDLLQEALTLLDPASFEVRVVGQGPDSPVLDSLRRMPGVSVENRWVPEAELGDLLGWADAVVLSHREASQSGVAAAAIAAGRWIVATQVGGLAEQLRDYTLARLCPPAAEPLAASIGSLLIDPPAALPMRGNGFRHSAINLTHQLAMAFNIANGLA
jgi:glycosyltransferase involved in cell wall biosynthesis